MSHTTDTLLSNDEIGLQSDDGIAHLLDLLLLDLENPVPVLLFADLNVCLTLALLVLQCAVQQQNTRVLDSPPHLWVCDVLVDHDSVQNLAVFDLASGNLLDTCVALDVDLLLSRADVERNSSYCLQCQSTHQVRPPRNELCADGGVDDLVHLLVVVDVDFDRDLADDFEGIGKGLLESLNDDDGVDVALQLGQSLCEDLSRCLLSMYALEFPRTIYAPNMMTVVVPSPTSSSCVLLSSIMLLAAGCATSISRRIAFPSFVRLQVIKEDKSAPASVGMI